jgi:hypothetical protein
MPCDAYSEKESSLGFGRDDAASLAGKESAIVLSSIFSRFAFEFAGSTTRSSGSLPRFFAAGFSGGAAFLGRVSNVLQKVPDKERGQGISEKLFPDNFETKEKNRWPERRLSEKAWIGKNCSERKEIF